MGWFVAMLRKAGNAYRILAGKPLKNVHLEDMHGNGKVILV
jgi:hypothetical protein